MIKKFTMLRKSCNYSRMR